MIYMTEGAKSRTHYYTQTNNNTEILLKKYKGSGYLVSCGPTAMLNCISPFGYDVDITSPTGKWFFQPEECVTDFLNDVRNYPKLKSIRDVDLENASFAGQEIPQYYPYAASILFGATARFDGFWKNWSMIVDHIKGGGTVQICLENPGHYLAVVGYDSTLDVLIYNDPWPGRHDDGNGFHVSMDKVEYNTNVKSYVIWYYPKGVV